MRTVAVIGKNFGDEGKGLAVDYLAMHAKRPLVVRHNGGAQSGHTVEYKNAGGKQFVFHELSSGSLRGAETLWINSFYPDIYKLCDETESFRAAFGFVPRIYAMEDTCVTIPDDVLINMALETSRGSDRHGSCGMGINECDLRTKAGYGLSLRKLSRMRASDLCEELSAIRDRYVAKRVIALGDALKSPAAAEYMELLSDDNVIKNAAVTIADNMRYVEILSKEALAKKLKEVDTLIFESGQGLLLDCDNTEYAPHVTASHTGLYHPCAFLERFGLSLDEAIYVSRSYVTRHGAGKLNGECSMNDLGAVQMDKTNTENAWQGQLRYARHENAAKFVSAVQKDKRLCGQGNIKTSLLLTHLNETNGCIIFKESIAAVKAFIEMDEIRDTFDRFYLSDSRFSEDIKVTV